MPRASKKDTERHHDEILAAASRLLRERGPAGLTVPELMSSVGLTHGGFYGHFASKNEVARVALDRAYGDLHARLRDVAKAHPADPAARRRELAEDYLSTTHRDAPGSGCPTAALSADVAREPEGSPLRGAYVAGVRGVVKELEAFVEGDGKRGNKRKEALNLAASLIGALILARAADGDPLSEEMLAAVREHLARL